MEPSLLYPDCDFSIWFRSVSEDVVTEAPIEGIKTGTILGDTFHQMIIPTASSFRDHP